MYVVYVHIFIYIHICTCVYIYLYIRIHTYTVYGIWRHFVFLKSQSMIQFSRSILPFSIEKRPTRLQIEIEQDKSNRLYTCICIHTYINIHTYVCVCVSSTFARCPARTSISCACARLYERATDRHTQRYMHIYACIHAHVYIHISMHIEIPQDMDSTRLQRCFVFIKIRA